MAWFSIFQIALALLYIIRIGEFLFWLLAFMTGFEATASIHWALLPFGRVTPLAWFADLERVIFYIFAPLAPLVVLTMIFIVTLKLLAPRYLILAGQFFKQYSPPKTESKPEIINLHPRTLLIISLVLSVVGALYPYNLNINPEGITFGVDVYSYLDLMGPVNQDFLSAFTVAGGSRPIILLVIFGVQHIFGLKLIDAIKYLPVLLNPLLVLSVFFMVFQSSDDLEWAALASLFSALGFTTTVGLYSYYLTNILAMILIFSAIGFLFNTVKTKCNVSLILACILGSLTIFTHPWTFIQYYIVILFTTLYLNRMASMKYQYYASNTFMFFLLFTGTVDIIKVLLIRGLGSYGSIISVIPHIKEVFSFWDSNIHAFRLFFGGLLSNTIFIGLSTFGCFELNNKKSFHLFLNMLLATTSICYVFADGTIQTRLLFNIPFSVFSALYIINSIRNTTIKKNVRFIIFIFTATYMFNYVFGSLANLI